MSDRLAFARYPSQHGWQFGDVLVIVEDYDNAMSVRNKRTDKTATVLTSALELIPARAQFREDMIAMTAREAASGISGAHGCFHGIGLTYAALALFEAMSEISEERICASWEIGNGKTIWSWIQTGEMRVHGGNADEFEPEKESIIALANVCGLWWADYHYAIPLAEWVDEHGEAPGVEVVRPSPEQLAASAPEPGTDGV